MYYSNIFLTEYPDDSIVLVTARLDAMGMFDQMQIGSETPVTGIVTLLAVAKLLADFQKFVPGRRENTYAKSACV